MNADIGLELFSLFFIIIITLLWFYGRKNYNYWNEKGVFNNKPSLPFFGNIKLNYLFKSNLELINNLYKDFSNKPYAGIYLFTKPAIIVSDPDLIKKILVTDFSYFVSRGFHTNDHSDPLSKNLIHVNGKYWKLIRPKLQSAFAINKLKNMVPDMDRLAKTVIKQIETGNVKCLKDIKDNKSFEAINISERYMIDVICSSIFGIKSNAIDFNFKSDFYNIATNIFSGYHFLTHVFVGYLFPSLHKLFNMSIARKHVTNFFTLITKEAISIRKKCFKNDDSKDFLDSLIRMTDDNDSSNDEKHDFVNDKDSKIEGSNEMVENINGSNETNNIRRSSFVCDENFVAANIFMFFAAGYDSSAKICTFCLYELAANQDVQRKAREEVVNILQEYDDNLTLEAVQKMTYLEQIVSETNRKYPILLTIFRKCDKEYQMPDGGIIAPGTPVIIPSSALHYDPEYYPDPQKFDPDRFSEENKRNIHPSTHLPFGMGPRICVAWRFAIVEIKVILARILSQYDFSLHQSNSDYPLKLHPKSFLLSSSSDIYINFKESNNI